MFLGHVIKEDRKRIKLSQDELQRKINYLSVKRNSELSEKQKEALLSSSENSASVDERFFFSGIPTKLISNIERGIARAVSEYELGLIAEVLGVDVEKYLTLEQNPLKLINKPIEPTTYVAPPSFERSIKFEPEFRQAGISILSFFSELVENEFGGQSVKIGIMQNGNVVTLRVETPEGELLKEVEKALNQYGLAVMGKAPIDTVSSNPRLVQELKTRLEVTSLELKLRKEATLEQSRQYESRISNLENQIHGLHTLVGQNLLHQNSLTETIRNISSSPHHSDAFLKALSVIESISKQNQSVSAERELQKSFKVIENESPGILSRLAKTIESIPAGIATNIATPWVQAILAAIPK